MLQTRVFNPAYWTGPIFTKELRVSANRARSYSLRSIYLGLLLILVFFTWLEVVHQFNYSYRPQNMARIAEAGKRIAANISWFQFITLQVITIILLSNSLSEEIHKRTLSTLMTTPIQSHQIVFGKSLPELLPHQPIASISWLGNWLLVPPALCVHDTHQHSPPVTDLLSYSSRRIGDTYGPTHTRGVQGPG